MDSTTVRTIVLNGDGLYMIYPRNGLGLVIERRRTIIGAAPNGAYAVSADTGKQLNIGGDHGGQEGQLTPNFSAQGQL